MFSTKSFFATAIVMWLIGAALTLGVLAGGVYVVVLVLRHTGVI